MADFSLKPIIIVFVAVILGVTFIGEIADNQIENTQLKSVTNETLTIAVTNTVNESINITNGIGEAANSNIIRLVAFGNGTNNTDLASVIIGTNVNFSRNGSIYVSQLHFPGAAIYNVSYDHSTATGQTSNVDVTSVSFFGNATVNTDVTSGVNVGEEVNFTETGAITVSLEIFTSSDHNISYMYEGDLYVKDTKSHPLLKLITLFFAIIIIAIAIGGMMAASDGFKFGFKQ